MSETSPGMCREMAGRVIEVVAILQTLVDRRVVGRESALVLSASLGSSEAAEDSDNAMIWV